MSTLNSFVKKLFTKSGLFTLSYIILTIVAYILVNPQNTMNSLGGIAIDSQNNIYVFNSAHKEVQKYNNKGERLLSWGGSGTGPGQFNQLDYFYNGLAVDSQDAVYVVDSDNNRVEKFDANGEFLFAFNTQGNSSSQYNRPTNVAVDKQGNIYVSNGQLQKFDATGKFLQTFDIKDNNDGYEDPNGIAIDQQGNVLIICAKNILKFTFDGKFIMKWPHFGFSNTIALDSAGNVYTADREVIRKFDATGKLLKTWNTSDNSDFSTDVLAVDSNNVIYEAITMRNDAAIKKYDTSGNYLGSIAIGLPNWLAALFVYGISIITITNGLWAAYKRDKRRRANQQTLLNQSEINQPDNRLARNAQLIALTGAVLGMSISGLYYFIKVLFLMVGPNLVMGSPNRGFLNPDNIISLVQLILFVVGLVLAFRISRKPLQAGFGLIVVGTAIIATLNLTLVLFALMLVFAGVLSLMVSSRIKPSWN